MPDSADSVEKNATLESPEKTSNGTPETVTAAKVQSKK